MGLILVFGGLGITQTSWSQPTETPVAVAETSVNSPIPDNDFIGISHSLKIFGSVPLESMEVAIQIDHPAVEELVITLQNPYGVKIILHNRTSSPNHPFSPIYETGMPSAESINLFLGINPQGDWTLTVTDLVPGNSGTLVAWGIRIQPASLLQPLPPTPIPLPLDLFTKAAAIPVDVTPTNGVSGDANHDALDDLFLISETGNQAIVYFSNGSQLSDLPLRYSIDRPQKIVLGDFNRDANLDFAIASQDREIATTHLSVFLANIAGGFSQGFTTQIATPLDHFAAFDATGDGIPDLIAGGVPQLIEGVGDGSFHPARQLVYLGQTFLTHADLNEDGLEDLLVALSRGGTSPNSDPYLLFGNHDLSFPLRQKIELENPVLDAFFSDVNEPDQTHLIMISTIPSVTSAYQVTSIQGESFPQITVNRTRIPSGIFHFPIHSIDLNGDGLDEWLSLSSSGISAFQKYPALETGNSTLLVEHPSPKAFVTGNYFSDGSIGMAVIDSSTQVTLYRSTLGPLPTPTPYMIPTPTPTSFLFPATATETPTPTSTFTPTPSPTVRSIEPDLNRDGIVDKRDLLILLEYWGNSIP